MFLCIFRKPLVVFFLCLSVTNFLRDFRPLAFDELVYRDAEFCKIERICRRPFLRRLCLAEKNIFHFGLEFLGDFWGNGKILALFDGIEIFGEIDLGVARRSLNRFPCFVRIRLAVVSLRLNPFKTAGSLFFCEVQKRLFVFNLGDIEERDVFCSVGWLSRLLVDDVAVVFVFLFFADVDGDSLLALFDFD